MRPLPVNNSSALHDFLVRGPHDLLHPLLNNDRDISGWDGIEVYSVQVRNTREVPVEVEITRNFESPYWDLQRTGEIDGFEKVDLDTVKFTVELSAHARKMFEYTLTSYHGVRTEDWTRSSR